MNRVRLVLATVLAAVVAVLVAPLSAQAAGSAEASPLAVQACSGGELDFCLAPQNLVLSSSAPYCTPFSDGLEWQSYTDANGVQQLWTYSNGSHACIQINYYPTLENYNCYYYFYVPANGYANGDIVFGWWDSSGVKHYATVVNENDVSGWVQLEMNDPNGISGGASNVTKISFQDNNGQTAGSTVMGWGNSSAYGIEEFC